MIWLKWIIIIAVPIIIIALILKRRESATYGGYRSKEKGLAFGRLDRALQSDDVHRETGEFTIAIDMLDIDQLVIDEEYDDAEAKVREALKTAEDTHDTMEIANLMGYLEKIQNARKRRF